jgi:hypothetical protein
MFVRLGQILKQPPSRDWTLSGMVRQGRETQTLKAPVRILVRFVDSVRLVKLLQPAKAKLPITRTLSGIFKVVNAVVLKALSPMLVTVFGMVTLARLEQLAKAKEGIAGRPGFKTTLVSERQ